MEVATRVARDSSNIVVETRRCAEMAQVVNSLERHEKGLDMHMQCTYTGDSQ